MTLEFRNGIGVGRTEVFEDGEPIGYTQQNQYKGMIRREEECKRHGWSAVTIWGHDEVFPGDKAPRHWQEEHGPKD